MKKGIFYRWQEKGLYLARWLVIGFAIFQLVVALAGIAKFPAYVSQHTNEFTPNDSWTPEETKIALQTLGWSSQTIGWIDFSSNIFTFVICYSLGFLLLRRKSQNAFSLFLALVFFFVGGFSGSILKPATIEVPVLQFIFHDILGAISWQLFFIIFYLFPDGKPVPGWSRWVILAWLIFMVLGVTPLADTKAFNSIGVVFGIGFVLFAIGSQVYRQWKHSSAIQVQQTKWVVYSLVVFFLILIPLSPMTFREPSLQTIGRDLVIAVLFDFLLTLFLFAILGSILIAILRYRLYEIDRIISRTLVYSLLTGLLGLVYFGSVALLQGLVPTESGNPSPVIIVVTTLAIATLFNPLRIRLQNIIDRRFYRQKYDSEKALADFAAAARNETDLGSLSSRLNTTIEETLQPEQVSLWLSSQART